MTEREELRKLAVATKIGGPGVWDDAKVLARIYQLNAWGTGLVTATEFIAAANPAAVLGLLDQLDAAEAKTAAVPDPERVTLAEAMTPEFRAAWRRSLAENEHLAAHVGCETTLLDALDELQARLDVAEGELDRVALAMGCAESVEGCGTYREDVEGMIGYVSTLRQLADEHEECPVMCDDHEPGSPTQWEWRYSCPDCHGSGVAGPTIIEFINGYVPDSLAHPGECESCAGVGRDHDSPRNLVTFDYAKEMELAALDELHAAEAKLAAVRALHRRRPHGAGDFVSHRQTEFPDVCSHCRQIWPCWTIRAIDGEVIA